jgi:hypothetical protein
MEMTMSFVQHVNPNLTAELGGFRVTSDFTKTAVFRGYLL